MPVTVRLAFRNLFEHRAKSLIIGILLALGSMVLVVGNAFIDASKEGIRSSFTDNYTGEIFVSGISEDGDVSLFGVMSPGGFASTPTIPEYDKVLAMVGSSSPSVRATGMATGYAIIMRGEESGIEEIQEDASQEGSTEEARNRAMSRFLFLFGIDASNYWDVFDSAQIVQGSRLQPGQQGLILSETQLKKLSELFKRDIRIGDSLTLQGFSSGGFRLREVPIVGSYAARGDSATPEQLAYIDIDTLRVMTGMTVGSDEDIELSEAQTAMLSIEDTDSLFGDDMLESRSSGSGFDEAKLVSALSDTQIRQEANQADTGAWQFIVARIPKGSSGPALIKELNLAFAKEGIAARAGNWEAAAGPYGQSVDVIRIVFTAAIAILSIVAIIIIMNTFVISVIERTSEIGTMRAIGADRGFIRRLFAAEALVLSSTFSALGAILGSIVSAILRGMKIEAGNPFLEVLFGGKYLNLSVGPWNFIGAILAMVLVGYLAHLYPVRVALKIQPVRAMQQE